MQSRETCEGRRKSLWQRGGDVTTPAGSDPDRAVHRDYWPPTVPLDFSGPTTGQAGHPTGAGQRRGERRKNHRSDLLSAATARPTRFATPASGDSRWRALQFDASRTGIQSSRPIDAIDSLLQPAVGTTRIGMGPTLRSRPLPTTLTPGTSQHVIAMMSVCPRLMSQVSCHVSPAPPGG